MLPDGMLRRPKKQGYYEVRPELLQGIFPSLEFFFSLFACDAMLFLYFPQEDITFSSNEVHIVVGEFTLPLPGNAFDLFPVSFDLIPVHGFPPL